MKARENAWLALTSAVLLLIGLALDHYWWAVPSTLIVLLNIAAVLILNPKEP